MIKHGMEIEETKLPEIWSVRLIKSTDYRGGYSTFFRNDVFYEVTGQHITEGNLVDNHQYTFRGYHYSPHSWKLYLCLSGVLHYYLVNWDSTHPEYGQWQAITLQQYDGFIKHPRYATGMWSINESTLMVLQSQRYNPNNPDQETITKEEINVKLIGMNKKPIFYPALPMVLSERDTNGEYSFKGEHA